jgi:hypothetical protein
MKNIYIKTLLLLLATSLFACKDSFFDQKPYDSVPVGDAIKTEGDMLIATNGMYSGLRSASLYGRTIPFINDLMADNVYLSASNSGRYISQFNYSVNAQNADILNTWSAAYTVILRANNIINATPTETANTRQYKGEAYTIRALMYFELVKLFGKPYLVDANALGVPLILTFDPKVKPARNTVSEVYAQVISDLNQAYDLMTVNRPNSSYITKYVAKGLLSKVYLYKGDYTNAKTAALDVVTNGGYTLATSTNYVAYWTSAAPTTTKLETMFEVSADNVNNVGFDALANMYSQSGYGDGLATTDLYNLYSTTDIRRNLIVSGSRAGQSVYIVNKYPNVSNTNDKDDLKVLRYSDILLILSEAYYRTNDEVNALKYLNQVAQRRDPSFTGYISSGSTLLENIITERRKELAFEGDRFNDLNRLGRSIIRNSQYPNNALNIPISDFRRLAPIPQVELDANPNIQKNDGY